VISSVDAPVDTTKIFKEGYSTKEGHTGRGLHDINEIVERQRREGFNVKFEIRCDKNLFTAELTI